jgi:hypothetical protein
MPKSKPITPQELRELEASVLRAVAKQTEEDALRQRWAKKCAKLGKDAKDVYDAEVALRALQFAEGRHLNSPAMSKVLTRAGARNDIKFFIRLGKVLAKRPVVRSNKICDVEIPLPSKLIQFLIGRWTTRSGDIPELFYLTPIGLREVCAHCLKMNWLTVDAVVKLRQRLGLKPFKRGKIDAHSDGRRLRFQQLDK